jgi:hypothetical protein
MDELLNNSQVTEQMEAFLLSVPWSVQSHHAQLLVLTCSLGEHAMLQVMMVVVMVVVGIRAPRQQLDLLLWPQHTCATNGQ